MTDLQIIIQDFLDTYGVKTNEDEDSTITELYMDDHICIYYNDQLYYIPDTNAFYTKDDEFILNSLITLYNT